MARPQRARVRLPEHDFRNKLVLNQWLISLFGIDPLIEHKIGNRVVRPFHKLAEPLVNEHLDGLDESGRHYFYQYLSASPLFGYYPGVYIPPARVTKADLLRYEENIAKHTIAINARRDRPIVWKYYQWLTLLFVEVYFDWYFNKPDELLKELNDFVKRFNDTWKENADLPAYTADDLNKICLQNATGSGKTLLMHVNLLQYRAYAGWAGRANDLSRVILLTPNESLSKQHVAELAFSNISAANFAQEGHSLFTQAQGLHRVDVLEITKLADQEGPNTIATRSLGDQNLLLVDEGHRGMSGKEEGVWFERRRKLCEKGFTIEYSATFDQAVKASGNRDFENTYAKSVLFDYSYRWFYEDGYGKDYQILNLPKTYNELRDTYLTACLLKFYQQLRLYEDFPGEWERFNIEKPLWVFVGSTVSGGRQSAEESDVATDVGRVVQFIAAFLANRPAAERRIAQILNSDGAGTGLLDSTDHDIFEGAFAFLNQRMDEGESIGNIYGDILARLFQNPAGGQLALRRVKGTSGEITLHAGVAETPFGLINVGDSAGLSDHIKNLAAKGGPPIEVTDSDFSEAIFESVKDSSSPVNLLIGSKKFIEGWDCWRVSTMGLMRVGRSEGTQIIQLFGRGVRLKGYAWSLKRSGRVVGLGARPNFIEELETLNVFGIEADFMQRFKEFLSNEGLPGNERRHIETVALNVTYDFGKRLKILRAKKKASNGTEYDFKKDGPVPYFGEVPEYLTQNRVVSDWYPRVQAIASRKASNETSKASVKLGEQQLAFLDYDALYLELERFKRERSWHNLNINRSAIRPLLQKTAWYDLYLPETVLIPANYDGIRLLQQVATELLRRYLDRYYNYCKSAYLEPRLELRELTSDDTNLPRESTYQIVVDGNDVDLVRSIQKMAREITENREELTSPRYMRVCYFNQHLYQPLFHVIPGGRIDVLPISLNESEFRFVDDLRQWYEENESKLAADGTEIYLLRNLSRGKGVGFFEAGGFYPDFILWVLKGNKQYITFVDPHGLQHEGPNSPKVQFHRSIKQVEVRLGNPSISLESYILSPTPRANLFWSPDPTWFSDNHVLFMEGDPSSYIPTMVHFD